MLEDFGPGSIAVSTQYYQKMPTYGLILPNEPFLKLFEREKVSLPEIGMPTDLDNIFKFGPEWPTDPNRNMFLGSKAFLESDQHYGLLTFGKVFLPEFGRQLEYEVMRKNHIIAYPLPVLAVMRNARQPAYMEMHCNPIFTEGIDYDMGFIVDFFSGRFIGKN